MKRLDLVDALAIVLLLVGGVLFVWGLTLDPPGSTSELILDHFGDWTPGFVIDGILLLVLNRVIRRNERLGVISQVGSLSNEFALDAVRRCRAEGWLTSGTMANARLSKAHLSSADLGDAVLRGADLSFSNLTGATLTHADLSGSSLRGANLSGADLRWADLSDADLSWSDLRDSLLDGAHLSGAIAHFASIDEGLADRPELRGAVAGGLLTPHQVELVEASFQSVLRIGDPVIAEFYERLFESAPHLRSLFTGDMTKQARKFLQSLKVIVNSLSSLDRATPVLMRLGERHRTYGVHRDDYQQVGDVLIATLAEMLGEEFTPEASQAWASAYDLISRVMSDAGPATQNMSDKA